MSFCVEAIANIHLNTSLYFKYKRMRKKWITSKIYIFSKNRFTKLIF